MDGPCTCLSSFTPPVVSVVGFVSSRLCVLCRRFYKWDVFSVCHARGLNVSDCKDSLQFHCSISTTVEKGFFTFSCSELQLFLFGPTNNNKISFGTAFQCYLVNFSDSPLSSYQSCLFYFRSNVTSPTKTPFFFLGSDPCLFQVSQTLF